MTDTPCPDRETLGQFLLGCLKDDRSQEVESHFACCPHCFEQAEQLHLEDTLTNALSETDAGIDQVIQSVTATDSKTIVSEQVIATSNASVDLSFLSSPESDDEIGRLNGYRVLDVIGKGGMGLVFLAEDLHLHRKVALKVIKPEVASDDVMKERFLREARSSAALTHDHIVTVYQVGEENGVLFLAMQLLEGESLQSRLNREGTIPVDESLRIVRQTAQGLATAHKQGLIHRDIKPDNIWLESDTNRVKILDFGLASVVNDDSQLTQSGIIVGTPSYVSPEQAEGRRVDHRADLFSLGVMLYRMLTGLSPFARPTLLATLGAIGNYEPEPPHQLNPQVPQNVSSLVMRLIDKNPDSRLASAAELIQEIAPPPRQVEPLPKPPRDNKARRSLGYAALGALIFLAGVIIIIRDRDGNVVGKFFGNDGITVEIVSAGNGPSEPNVSLEIPPDKPASGEPDSVGTNKASEFLQPMSPAALVQRPARLTSRDGEGVLSWTVAAYNSTRSPGANRAIAIRPDGKSFATYFDDGHVRIWNVESQQLEKVLVGHGAGPTAYSRTNSLRYGPLTWHPSLPLLASASRDGSLRVWNTETGQTVFQQDGVADGFSMVAWSPDGTLLAAGYPTEGLVRIWSTNDWEQLKPVKWNARALIWSPDSSMLAVASDEIILWSPKNETFQLLEDSKGPDQSLTPWGMSCVRWSTNGSLLAHRAAQSVIIRDAKTLEVLRIFKNADASVQPADFAWSPDAEQLAVTWNKPEVRSVSVFSLNTETAEEVFELSSGFSQFRYLEWLPHRRTLLIGGHLFDLETQTEHKGLHLHEASLDGQLLLDIGDPPQVIHLSEDGHLTNRLKVATINNEHSSFVWSPDGTHIQLSNIGGDYLSVDESGQIQADHSQAGVKSLSPDGSRFVFGHPLGSLQPKVVSWPDGKVLHEFEWGFVPYAHSWSPDSMKFAVGSAGGSRIPMVQVIDVASGVVHAPWDLSAHFKHPAIDCISWSHDGKRLAIADNNGSTGIFSSIDGSLIHQLTGRASNCRWLIWGTDDQRIVVSRSNGILEVFSSADGKFEHEVNLASAGVAARMTHDDSLLVACDNGMVHEVNIETGNATVVREVTGHPVEFSPDGKFLAVDLANSRGIVRLADGIVLASIVSHDSLVNPEGHLWIASQPLTGPLWATAPELRTNFVYVVQTAQGQETLTPLEFAQKFGWQNDSRQVKLK